MYIYTHYYLLLLPNIFSLFLPSLLELFPCLFSSLLSISSYYILISIKEIYMYKKMNHAHQNQHQYLPPCLYCHPHSYIRMVQNLIERCLLLHMSREQCIKALAEHASIRPLVTLTVWRELQKENRDFFQAYFHSSPYPINNTRMYIHQTGPRLARDNRRNVYS